MSQLVKWTKTKVGLATEQINDIITQHTHKNTNTHALTPKHKYFCLQIFPVSEFYLSDLEVVSQIQNIVYILLKKKDVWNKVKKT